MDSNNYRLKILKSKCACAEHAQTSPRHDSLNSVAVSLMWTSYEGCYAGCVRMIYANITPPYKETPASADFGVGRLR